MKIEPAAWLKQVHGVTVYAEEYSTLPVVGGTEGETFVLSRFVLAGSVHVLMYEYRNGDSTQLVVYPDEFSCQRAFNGRTNGHVVERHSFKEQ